MPRIWKYEVPAAKEPGTPVEVALPRGATILPNAVAFQARPKKVLEADGRKADIVLVLWAYVEGEPGTAPIGETRRFLVLGTGWEFEVPLGDRLEFLGTAFVETFVFHLFEVVTPTPEEREGIRLC